MEEEEDGLVALRIVYYKPYDLVECDFSIMDFQTLTELLDNYNDYADTDDEIYLDYTQRANELVLSWFDGIIFNTKMEDDVEIIDDRAVLVDSLKALRVVRGTMHALINCGFSDMDIGFLNEYIKKYDYYKDGGDVKFHDYMQRAVRFVKYEYGNNIVNEL